MRMLVLGAGLQGSACAYDLLQQPVVERVTVADLEPDRIPRVLQPHVGTRLALLRLDVQDEAALRDAMRGHDAVQNAAPYYFNLAVSRAAVDAGVHCADLGGNTEIVFQQKALDAAAQARRVSIIPDCGLAPGMVNILAAEGIRRVGDAEVVKIYVGGLPQHPEPPLNYQIVYSLAGALDYYTTPSWVLRDGRPARVEALSELEHVVFPPPVGELEAFHTGGGISTLPWAYEGRVRTMEYKTLRYPGHVAIMRPIRELGLLELTPVTVEGKRVDQARRARPGRVACRGAWQDRRTSRLAAARLLRCGAWHQRHDADHRLFPGHHRTHASGWPDRHAGGAHARRSRAVRGVRR